MKKLIILLSLFSMVTVSAQTLRETCEKEPYATQKTRGLDALNPLWTLIDFLQISRDCEDTMPPAAALDYPRVIEDDVVEIDSNMVIATLRAALDSIDPKF